MKQTNRSITDFLNSEFRDYAIHTVYRRAIPSVVDGFKPAQRKAFYTALKVANNKFIKTVSLVGYVFPLTNYHHGDAAMADTIIGMTAPYSNNVPLFVGEGSFGSRLVPVAASPRYTSVKVNKDALRYFVDNEICPTDPDPENPEPKFYLPLIPMVLVNGTKGIATGFATTILHRSPEDVTKACIDYIENGVVCDDILPSFPQFNGNIIRESNGKYIVSGSIVRKSKTKIIVNEIPYGLSRTQYVDILQKLEDDGKILRFDDNCSKSGLNFEVILPREKASLSDEEILSLLKLKKKVAENYTLIDENCNLKVFDGVGDIIAHFCDFRVNVYKQRYAYYIERDTAKLEQLTSRLKFIEIVVNGEVSLKNKTRSQLFDMLSKKGFSKDNIEDFLRMPFSKFTKDEIDALKQSIEGLKENIERWKTIDPRQQYIEELKELLDK